MVQVKHRKMKLTHLVKECVEQNKSTDRVESEEKVRGRKEVRIVEVYTPIKTLQKDWPHLNKVITVRRIRTEKGQTTDKTHYYITSLKQRSAQSFGQIIRQHWAIENKLHWVKDVILKEDSTIFHNYKTFKLNALYRNFACSCIMLNKLKSIKYAMEMLKENPKNIIKLLRT